MNEKMKVLIPSVDGLNIDYVPMKINYAIAIIFCFDRSRVDLLWSGSFGAGKSSDGTKTTPMSIRLRLRKNRLLIESRNK